MKFNAKRYWAVGILPVLFWGSPAAAQQPGGNTLDRAQSVISSELFQQTAKTTGPGKTVIIVGENHASVKTQKQLAEMLDALYKARLVDAVLIEGSNGAVPVAEIQGQAGASTLPFWQGRLNLGQIAGYEYVALTRPGVTVFGIEDMKAKRDYTVDAARRGVNDSLRRQVEMHERAYAFAKQSLSHGGDPAKVATGQAELVEYRRRIDSLAAALKVDGKKYAELEAQYTADLEDRTLIYNKVRRVLPLLLEVGKEQDQYNALVQRAKSYAAGKGTEGINDTDDAAKKLLASLRTEKAKLDALAVKLDKTAKDAGYADFKEAIADVQKLSADDSGKPNLLENLSAASERLDKLESSLMDQFYILANSAREAAGKPVRELQRFLSDERARSRERESDSEVPFLADRDVHMVANTMRYLRENQNVRTVALIIGYAHLDSITKRLRDNGVSVLAGRVASSRDDIEDWETRAWQVRSRPAVRVFSKDSARKELSRLLDSTFKEESDATIRKLQALMLQGVKAIPSGKGQLYELGSAGAGNKAVAVAGVGGMETAHWGSQVVDRGYLPASDAKQAYLVFDRDVAKRQAKQLSTDKYQFVPSHRTRTTQGLAMQFDTQAGTVGIETFRASVPKTSGGKVPGRVILVTEPDAGATYRSLKANEAPRTAAGGGRGHGGEPPWTSADSVFADEPGSNRKIPSLLQTINAERAKAKIDTLLKQEPLRYGEVLSVKIGFGVGETSLTDALWFTPGRGDRARVLLIAGENTEVFRAELRKASEAGLLRNKQVIVASCFDANESPGLREMLLDSGALMVWAPERKITPQAAEKLDSYVQRVVGADDAKRAPGTIDEAVPAALRLWHRENPTDPDLRSLMDGSHWVLLRMPIGTSPFILQSGAPLFGADGE